jgi:hypothetical protein
VEIFRPADHPERSLLVADLYNEPGQTFRVSPRQMWGVQNNLSLEVAENE